MSGSFKVVESLDNCGHAADRSDGAFHDSGACAHDPDANFHFIHPAITGGHGIGAAQGGDDISLEFPGFVEGGAKPGCNAVFEINGGLESLPDGMG